MEDSKLNDQRPFPGWKLCLGVSLGAPFITSWYLSGVAQHNGSDSLLSVYIVSGLFAIFAVWVTFSSPLKMRAKLALCFVAVGVQALATWLGLLVEFLQGGFGLGI